MKNFIPYFYLLLGLLVFTQCKTSIDSDKISKMDEIYYRFSDSSTPPRYHRSYSITVTPKESSASVDVYGDLLASDTHPMTQAKFDAFKSLLKGLEPQGEKVSNGATGTKGYRIKILAKGEVVYDFYWDSLQDVNQETQNLKEAIKNTIPNLGQLLMTPYKEED